MKLTIVGTGYVGLVSGVGLAELGHQVFCVDTDENKIKTLKAGKAPFFEPGLVSLLKKNIKDGRLDFTTKLASVINKSPVIFICVGTPPRPDGSANLTYAKQVAKDINRDRKSTRLNSSHSSISYA